MNTTIPVIVASALSLWVVSAAAVAFDPAFSRSYDRPLLAAGQKHAAPADAGSAIATNGSRQVVSVERAVESMDSHRDN